MTDQETAQIMYEQWLHSKETQALVQNLAKKKEKIVSMICGYLNNQEINKDVVLCLAFDLKNKQETIEYIRTNYECILTQQA